MAKVTARGNIKDNIAAVCALLGDTKNVFARGKKVLIKPNFNSPDPFPAATDPEFLKAVIEFILETGANVTIGPP